VALQESETFVNAAEPLKASERAAVLTPPELVNVNDLVTEDPVDTAPKS
jgi:hypothetical protein